MTEAELFMIAESLAEAGVITEGQADIFKQAFVRKREDATPSWMRTRKQRAQIVLGFFFATIVIVLIARVISS